MKVEIKQGKNGFTVHYNGDKEPYVYKATEDLWMWEEIAKQFLKRKIKAIEQ